MAGDEVSRTVPGVSRQPQGWYPDPTGRHQHRWWTGRAWAAAVADDGVQSSDADGLVPGAPELPSAAPEAADHASVVAACGAATLPGDDPATAPVLTIWRRRSGMVDLHPTWSVHDGTGRWLGTTGLEVAGTGPNDRRFVLRRPDGSSITCAPHLPEDVARLTDGTGRVLASITVERGQQRLAASVDGMTVAHATYSVGEVAVTDAAGAPVGRLVPTPLKVRRAVGRRVGWDPVLVSEQLATDPITGRGVDALALAWEHTLREWVGS